MNVNYAYWNYYYVHTVLVIYSDSKKTCDYVFGDCPFATILAHLLLSVYAIDICFYMYFPTSPISCAYFTLENCRDLISVKNKQNHENFTGRCYFDLKSLSVKAVCMMHEGR